VSSAVISVWETWKAVPCKSRGLYVGCTLLFAYWVINFYKKKTFSVELDEIAVIVICSEGITSSGQFLVLIPMTANDSWHLSCCLPKRARIFSQEGLIV